MSSLRAKFLVLVSALASILFSCSTPISSGSSGLEIRLSESVSRTLLPALDMNVDHYVIQGSGPQSKSFLIRASGSSAVVQDLAFGLWTVTVEARNAADVAIGEAKASVEIHSGQRTQISMTVKPFSGFGGIDLSVRWPDSSVEVPRVVSELVGTVGLPRTLDWTVEAQSAKFAAQDVPTGYHTLILKLFDRTTLVKGAVEIVRIVRGQTTYGQFVFNNLNVAYGSLAVDLSVDLERPLTVNISSVGDKKPVNRSWVLTASVEESDTNPVYVWYVDGEAKATGRQFDFGTEWNKGFYRIDVTAFGADGKRAGSATQEIEVVDASTLGSISGTIRKDGAPLSQATIALEGTPFSTTSDSSGAWRISGLNPGTYTVSVAQGGTSFVPDRATRNVVLSDRDVQGIDFTGLSFVPTAIHDLQGATHVSSFHNKSVSNVLGVVTLVDSNQFYLQGLDPDSDPATSEGILVYLGSAPTVSVGDWALVSGTVTEYYQSGATSGNLSITEIKNPIVSVLSKNHVLPEPIVIGSSGRLPPTSVYCDDSVGGTVDTSVFDPHSDGVDFYESLEFMRVSIEKPQVVGPTVFYASSHYRETAVVAEYGAYATGMTARGGIGIAPGDFNPEILLLNDKHRPLAQEAQVADRWSSAVTGVLDYTFGSFKIFVSENWPTFVEANRAKESTNLVAGPTSLTIASYNAENLSVVSPVGGIAACAQTIVDTLKSPDIVVVSEIQDNNGEASGSSDASTTWTAIVTAVSNRGGPNYSYRQIDPVNNQDGGASNGNIRQGFLFNASRVQFVDRGAATSTSATTVSANGSQAVISQSPGRIDPTNAAFQSSRKPLVGEFQFLGQKIYVIANHLNSKGGDTPLFGRYQPPNLKSEVQRLKQVQVLNAFCTSILAIEPQAKIVVAGDLNDFEFSNPIQTLSGGILTDLVNEIEKTDRYSYVYLGNSQVLDHILVSASLAQSEHELDIVHCNAEYPEDRRTSDHDPLVARLKF